MLGFLAALWHCALVPVLGAVVIVYVTFKVGSAMKPRACTNKTLLVNQLGP